ncbi:hypothetical protein G3I39_15145, partial [Streptomyces fulvissimus]|nr:hypothetical protein [Streptomyces microflavus]
MHGFLTGLEEIADQPPRHMLLLYSGGVDGTYLLQRLQSLGVRVTALHLRIGDRESSATAAAHARQFGASFIDV